MMEFANLWDFQDPTQRRRLDRSADGWVLAQLQVSPRSLVVVEVGLQKTSRTGFIEDDHMVQALATDRLDLSLRSVALTVRTVYRNRGNNPSSANAVRSASPCVPVRRSPKAYA